jgi:DNA-binding NarL/FixJ family response regulator
MAGIHRIILADDHTALRREVKMFLESGDKYSAVGEAGDGLQLLELLRTGPVVDAVILDLMMPFMTGIETANEIRRLGLDVKILVLTMHRESDLLCRAFKAGVNGYVLKDGIAKDLRPGLRAVLDGKLYLSPVIRDELPGTCNLRHFEGRRLTRDFVHCTA